MKVLFIYTTQDAQSEAKPLQRQEDIPFGISYISSCLKTRGHKTELLVLTRSTKYSEIDRAIAKLSPKLICFTAVATEYHFVSKIAKYIKVSYPDIFLLVGGIHATIYPEEILGDMRGDAFDALCIGEGEQPVLNLVGQLELGLNPSRIPNLWIRKGQEIEKNPTRPFNEDLDNLPFPDREMWQKWIRYPDTQSHIPLGRGCPYLCSHCCNHAIRKVSSGKYVRFRTPGNIIKEIKEVVTRYPKIKSFHLEIETFGANVKWAKDLCSNLEKLNEQMPSPLFYEVNFRVVPNASVEGLESLFQAMKAANILRVNIGLESGSERIRREVLKRRESNEDIARTVEIAKKHGIRVNFYVMAGIVGETLDDFKETINFCRMCQPDSAELHIFFPYPGSDLYFLAKEKGLLGTSLDTEMERYKATLELPGFTRKQIQRSSVLFEYYVFRGRKPLYVILLHVIVRFFRTRYYLNKFYKKLTSFAPLYRVKEFLQRAFF